MCVHISQLGVASLVCLDHEKHKSTLYVSHHKVF